MQLKAPSPPDPRGYPLLGLVPSLIHGGAHYLRKVSLDLGIDCGCLCLLRGESFSDCDGSLFQTRQGLSKSGDSPGCLLRFFRLYRWRFTSFNMASAVIGI